MSTRDTFRRQRAKHEYGQSWMLAAALLEGPRSFAQIEEYYAIMGRRFGLMLDLPNRDRTEMQRNLEHSLQILLERGWALAEGDQYRITDSGREEAERMLSDLEKGGRFIEQSTCPETVSKVTLVVHFVMAALKLPAALLSGSVGLLNDALDTLMDGVASLFVFFGVRSGRERLVSYILLSFMILTGGYALYGAVLRFLRPEPLSGDWLAFIAVAISAAVCALLWLYQKFTGLKHSCVPLIAQSIDSRNHIIVAGGVAAGLVAARFEFMLLDQVVGLAVAILILKAAVELLADLIRSREDGEIDLSKYGFSRLDRHRQRQLLRWFLFEIQKGEVRTKEEILLKARAANDFSRIVSLRALGLDQPQDQRGRIEAALRALFDEGLVSEVEGKKSGTTLQLTVAGEAELERTLSDTWRFSMVRNESGPRALSIRLLGFVLRLLFTAGLFSAIYAAGRWVIGFLPGLDVWESGAFPMAWLDRSRMVGPFTLSRAQLLCGIVGVLFLQWGGILLHGARHAVHYARSGQSERPRYLVTDGPYAVRRHPMYTAFILINMGIGIGLHSVYTLAWAGLVLLLQSVNAYLEERRLAKWFGAEFRDYAAEVKQRFLPWWSWIIIAIAYAAAWLGA